MKKILLFTATIIASFATKAQQVLNNVILKATMEIQMESDGESNGMMMRGPGETKMKITIKDSMSRVDVNSDFANNITIKNSSSKITTSLTEAQGEKTGYFTNEKERDEQKKIMDSIIKERQSGANAAPNGGMTVRMGGATNVKKIDYLTDVKTINAIACKKAIVTVANNEGEESKIEIWYTDAYLLPQGTSMSTRGMLDFSDLKGIPIQFATVRKMSMGSNEMTITMTYTVSEIKQNATIEAKDFEVPKGYKVKTYAQWKKDNPEGGMPQIRGMMRIGG